jgi:SEC-C motif-containing protein
MNCPCGSGKKYKKCCQPFHKGKAKPKTALGLMKSRYSAYAKGEVKYIIKTTAKDYQKELNEQEIKLFCESNFKKLAIIDFSKNMVEFKAYIDDYILHEKSEFIKEDFEWRYLKGKIY